MNEHKNGDRNPSVRRRLARWRRKLSLRMSRSSYDPATVILESGLFDPDWYLARYPDVAEAELDPLEHFVAHGGSEGRKPGPGFDSRWYMDRYSDVRSSGMNPLVHFILRGEGREPMKRIGLKGVKTSEADFRDAAEILQSPLFEASAYARKHLDEKQLPATAALHYLKIGAFSGEPAGPDFDSAAYLRAYSDVAEAGLNPLLHFIRHGAAEGRRAFTTQEAAREVIPFKPRPRRPESPPTVTPAYDWLSSRTLKGRPGRALAQVGGVTVGLLADVYDDRTEPLPASLHHALHRLGLLSAKDQVSVSAKLGRAAREIPAEPAHQAHTIPRLTDGWFVNDGMVRLRFEQSEKHVVRLLQVTEHGKMRLVGEAALDGGRELVDAALWNPYQPILIVYAAPTGRLTGGDLIGFPSLLRNGPHNAEIAAMDWGQSSADRREHLESLLFQKLAVARHDGAFAIGTIAVDLEAAHGAEKIFSGPVLTWLSDLGLSMRPLQDDLDKEETAANRYLARILTSCADRVALRSATGVLTLSADSLPTLEALFALKSDYPESGAGAFLLSDVGRSMPRWLTSLPQAAAELAALQPASSAVMMPTLTMGGGVAGKAQRRLGPLSIRFRASVPTTDARMIFPVAPDDTHPVLRTALSSRTRKRARISVVISGATADSPTSLIETLARQTLANALDILIILRPGVALDPRLETVLDQSFPRRYRIVPVAGTSAASDLNTAVETIADPVNMVLLCRTGIDLHDARTLETLYLLASHRGVATAGCVIVREGGFQDGRRLQFQSGGIFPAQISLSAFPAVTFRRLETLDALPLATYPVAGNDLGAAMIPLAAWRQLHGFNIECSDSDYELDFCLRALKVGFTHLCTSALTATDTKAKTFSPRSELTAPGAFDLKASVDMIDRVTILRALT